MIKTDAQVLQDVTDELSWLPSVDATHIHVEVNDGIVILRGYVSSYAEKWDAECAVQRVSGVKALAIEMDVRLPEHSRRNDADISRSAENILNWMTYVPRDRISVTVEDGWITLSGVVDWHYQKRAAAGAIRYLVGVTGISNDIVLRSESATSANKSDIEAALKRRIQGEPPSISVDVLGDKVILSGIARNPAERMLAMHAAWGTAGVHKVIDHITVAV